MQEAQRLAHLQLSRLLLRIGRGRGAAVAWLGSCTVRYAVRQNGAGAPREWRLQLLGSVRFQTIVLLKTRDEAMRASMFTRRLNSNDPAASHLQAR